MSEPEDPTRTPQRLLTPMYPAPANDPVTFHELWTKVACSVWKFRECAKRTALTKADLPRSRLGPVRYVLHANFKCSACGADQPRLYQATQDEARMFLAGDPLSRQIGR